MYVPASCSLDERKRNHAGEVPISSSTNEKSDGQIFPTGLSYRSLFDRFAKPMYKQKSYTLSSTILWVSVII